MWSIQVNVLLKNCKQNITPLSLMAGRTVDINCVVFAGAPDTPSDISVSVLTGTSARVSWQTSYKGLLDRIFHIQIQAVGASTWRVWNVADTSLDGQMTYDIDGLLADTSYVLRMYASNAAGSSATSSGVSFVTQGTCILFNEQNF